MELCCRLAEAASATDWPRQPQPQPQQQECLIRWDGWSFAADWQQQQQQEQKLLVSSPATGLSQLPLLSVTTNSISGSVALPLSSIRARSHLPGAEVTCMSAELQWFDPEDEGMCGIATCTRA